MLSPINPSWYAQSQCSVTPHPALLDDVTAEVVIVGGGLTGISAALYLAERGVNIVLLEADRIGSQASGRNGGQALQGLAASMEVVERAVGIETAKSIWSMSCEGLTELKGNIDRFHIPCNLVEKGYVYAACHAGQMAALGEWQAYMAHRYGYKSFQLLDQSGMSAHVASNAYVGGLYDPHEAHLDPLAYTLGLAQAAKDIGANFYEYSRVISWQREKGYWRIRTATGSIRCQQILLAVNTGAVGLSPELARYFLPVDSFIVATAPLGIERTQKLIPSGVAIADCNRVLNYFRLSHDHRLLFGGRSTGSSYDRTENTRQRMLAVFPELADAAIEYAWGGQVDVPPNKLPQFGRLDDSIYYAQGFCGHGLALTGLAGKLVAEAMTRRPERFNQFAALPKMRLPTHIPGFSQLAVTFGMGWFAFCDWLEASWYA
ncbi:NAD(P)/FAD-dependent oxidoreductase [Chitinimonas sp. PSY-7]|uniref:FAD-dependent oxidoreductase n=1 Tax=Chitinimonas sp. PSY-7 TaxID=3459088 RepID=UPI0040402A31